MSHLFSFLFLSLLFLCLSAFPQKKWDGGGGDGQWSNPLNWTDNLVPSSLEEVILDNALSAASYTVVLPPFAVEVRRIAILPSQGKTILLELPSSNTLVPALSITGSGYVLDIGEGGSFRNASGASSGAAVVVADSIRIRNGGKYVHSSSGSHASNVQVLSAAPGTETGTMEFDVPDVSSTISLSGRIYGNLLLNAVSVAGGLLKYTAAGTNPVVIRNDLEVAAGVTCGLNFSDTISVLRNLVNNGVLDLGNTARRVVIRVNGNITQGASAVTTESGSGEQELLVAGNGPHLLNVSGALSNHVALMFNSTADITLASPLHVLYKLGMKQGRLNTSASSPLILGTDCIIEADTLSDRSFINGPVTTSGLSNASVVLPVGKAGRMRWIGLTEASGDLTVEYFPQDPYSLSRMIGPGLHHVSHLEYWRITCNSPLGSGKVKLSFSDPGSGGVTALSDLRAAALSAAGWYDAGRAVTDGSPGGDGWVSSQSVINFASGVQYVALASSSALQNPLPLSRILLRAESSTDVVRFRWNADPDAAFQLFELQTSSDGRNFSTINSQAANPVARYYECTSKSSHNAGGFARVMASGIAGQPTGFSNVIGLNQSVLGGSHIDGTGAASGVLHLKVSMISQGTIRLLVYDACGRTVKRIETALPAGLSPLTVDISMLATGVYSVLGEVSALRTNTYRFMKP